MDRFFLRLERANVSHATRSFAADFSEAQSFFVIVVAVALIYADSQGVSFQGADNWLSVRLNQQTGSLISLYSSLPTVLVQVALGLTSMDSVYSLVLTTAAMVLAGVASTLTEEDPDVTKIREMLIMDEATVGLPECGNNPSLRALCNGDGYSSFAMSRETYGALSVWPWLLLLGYLWFYKFRRCLRQKARLLFDHLQQAAEGSVVKTMTLLILRRLVWIWDTIVMPFMLPLAQLFLVMMTANGISGIFSEIKDSSQFSSDRSWTLGQVVAVLVWVPVLSKYIYTLLCKFLSASQNLLSYYVQSQAY
jgi:hypothetical protein